MAAVLVLPGMITDPQPPSLIVAILGAGPAGMSCANACLSFGLTPVVIERGAGDAAYCPDAAYVAVGAECVDSATARGADLVCAV